MTIWTASVGELLDLSADALICSANPQLNLSGGVGGEFLLRYGESKQQYLHDWLRRSGRRFAMPGTVVVAPSCGSPFCVVLHAVAIDAFYDTSADVIAQAYGNAFGEASRVGLPYHRIGMLGLRLRSCHAGDVRRRDSAIPPWFHSRDRPGRGAPDPSVAVADCCASMEPQSFDHGRSLWG